MERRIIRKLWLPHRLTRHIWFAPTVLSQILLRKTSDMPQILSEIANPAFERYIYIKDGNS